MSTAPPNSPGYSLLQILLLAERLDLDPVPSGADAGRWARVFLAAERDVRRHLADPDRMSVHVSTLLDDGHLASLVGEIESPLPPARGRAHPSGDTIALVTADAEGHAVSLIQSLFHGFGAGICEPATGIVAHDRGACFTLAPDLPATLTPGAQPPHTLLPVAIHDDRGFAGVAGTMGGYQQPQIDAQTIAYAFAGGVDPGTAVAAPRFVVDDLPAGDEVPAIVAEAGIDAVALGTAGFAVDLRDGPDEELGYAQLIVRSPGGALRAGSDPRADGGALTG
jgi:gamma-glutamyltranspeptidase/glutathione hydrolase